jgi:hypothetical protein
MSLHRRPVGRARLLAVVGALVTLVGSVPAWWTAGTFEAELPPISGYAFDGAGILVFLAALATLALITLPYAGDRPVGVDRWWAYAGLVALGWVALVVAMLGVVTEPGGLETITPDRGPGLWITIAGLVILSRAAYQIHMEPARH